MAFALKPQLSDNVSNHDKKQYLYFRSIILRKSTNWHTRPFIILAMNPCIERVTLNQDLLDTRQTPQNHCAGADGHHQNALIFPGHV